MDIREKLRTILYRNNKEEATDQILALIKEAGYRKVEGKPPVLSDKELGAIQVSDCWEFEVDYLRTIAQAQCDADVRFYEQQS